MKKDKSTHQHQEEEEQDLLQDKNAPVEEEDLLLSILNETSNVSCDIVEYIAGYIVRSLSSKIVCESCLKLLTSNTLQTYSLIGCKDRGGLIVPSHDVVKLCIMCDSVKMYKNTGKFTTAKNLLDLLILTVKTKCIGTNLFSEEHYYDQEPENNHVILLMKAVCKKYFTVRLHHYSKNLNESLHKKN